MDAASLRVKSVEMANRCIPNEIGSILSKQSFRKTAVESQAKYLNENIKDVRNIVTYQKELLERQKTYAVDRDCLQQLDYIFERKLLCYNAHSKVMLENKTKKKQLNITKITIDVGTEYDEMVFKYTQYHEHNIAKSGLYQDIVKVKNILELKKNTLKSLDQLIASKKKNVAEISDRNQTLVRIIKFSEMMQIYNKKNNQTLQVTENEEIKKQTEQKIKVFQNHQIAKLTHRSKEGSMLFNSDIGIGKYSLLPSLSQSAATVKLNSTKSQHFEQFLTASKKNQKKVKLYSKNVVNTSTTKMNTSIKTDILYSKLKSVKKTKSFNMVSSSQYFESSSISLNKTKTKRPSTILQNTETDTTKNNNATITDHLLSQYENEIIENSDKIILLDNQKASKNATKKVQFSAEIKKSFCRNQKSKDSSATKLDVINIIREDIVTCSSPNRKTSIILATENIQNIDNITQFGEYGYYFEPNYNSNYEAIEDPMRTVMYKDPSENSNSSDKLKDNLYSFKFNK